MTYLKDGPHNFMALLALVCGIFGVFHLVAEFEERVFDVVKTGWWGLARA